MKRFKDDYEVISSSDEKGRERQTLAYLGKYYEVANDEKSLTKIKRQSLLLLIVISALHVGNGFLESRSMYQFYVSFRRNESK